MLPLSTTLKLLILGSDWFGRPLGDEPLPSTGFHFACDLVHLAHQPHGLSHPLTGLDWDPHTVLHLPADPSPTVVARIAILQLMQDKVVDPRLDVVRRLIRSGNFDW